MSETTISNFKAKKKFVLLGLVAAALQAVAPAASARQVQLEYLPSDLMVTEWVGIAASPNRRVFQVANQSNETVARNAAKFECEQETGRTCPAIAVPTSWAVVVVSCARPGQMPLPIVAGSGQNAAMEVAFKKALAAGVDPSSCAEVYEY
jgi:hypothetical protein